MTAAEAFAQWALGLDLHTVPDGVRRDAAHRLLDGTGCAIAASVSGTGASANEVALAFGASDEAGIIGNTLRVSAPAAALANGVLIHALDFDDTHAAALIHATSVVLPSAFAVGEQTGASGAEVLAAAIAGYETVLRIGAAVPHAFHARGFHATSVCGVFGSALVAAKLMELTAGQTVHALGIAGSAAAGSLEFLSTGASTKQLHPGIASMNGIVAARLAGAGAEGPETIFEGEHGLFRAYLGERIDAGALTDGLGTTWETSRIDIKLYPACQLSHRPLDVLRVAMPEIGDPADVDKIVFDVPAGSVPIICEPQDIKRRPRTPYEAKFSLAYCAAAMMTDGALTVESFEPHRLDRKDVMRLAERVEYEEVAFDGPPAAAPAGVTVTMRDGRTVSRSAKETESRPADELIVGKFVANGGTREQATRILAIEDAASVGGLLP